MPKDQNPRDSKAKDFFVGSTASTAGQLVGGIVGTGVFLSDKKTRKWYIDPIKNKGDTKWGKDTARAIKKFKRQHDVKVPVKLTNSHRMSKYVGPLYIPNIGKTKEFHGVHMGGRASKPATIFHELGHAKSMKNVGKLRALALTKGMMAGGITSSALMIDDRTRPYAPLAMAAGWAPQLHEEAKASITAAKFMKGHYGAKSKVYKEGVKDLARAYSTHGLTAAGAIGGTIWAAKYLRDKKKNAK